MFDRASKKLGMDQALFSKGAFHSEGQAEEDIPSLSIKGLKNLEDTNSKNIESLLKYGAYAFMDEGEEGKENQADLNIEDILAKGKKTDYNKAGYSLNKSKFDAAKHESMPSFNDEHFWDKVLPMENISITSLEKRFKKEKKEIAKNEQLQYEFIKDLTIAVEDFFKARNEGTAKPKDLESSEESLRNML
jgi:chromodomain-helicase-DNA-binding protein 7